MSRGSLVHAWSGKSFFIALFTQKVHRKLWGDYTFVMLTDRTDLDKQNYRTVASVGLANNYKDPCCARSAAGLSRHAGKYCSTEIRPAVAHSGAIRPLIPI